MARNYFIVERGLAMVPENGVFADGVAIIFGTGAPGGTSETNAAPAGSFFFRKDAPYGAYKKTGTANTTADWEEVGNVSLDQLGWRNERVVAATNDTLSAGSGIDPTSWSDNESGVDATNWNVGDHVIGDFDGTPALFEITAKASATSITLAAAAQSIANNDTFICQSFLPDSPAANEAQAIVHFPSASAAGIKISDVNWQVASYIGLDPGFTPVNGNITSADNVNSALEKLTGNQQDLTTLSGEAQGATFHQPFSGSTIPDSSTTRQALQSLETAVEQVIVTGKSTGITTATVVNSVLTDDYHKVAYEIVAWEEASPANKKFVRFECMHNGTASADATDEDNTTHTILALGSVGGNFLQVSASLTGTGASQNLNLVIASNTAGITVEWRRVAVPVL